MLSNVTGTGKSISCLPAICQPDFESRSFAWPVWPLHSHWWNIMSDNLVTEIKKKLTHSKIRTPIDFTRDRSWTWTFWLSIPLATQEPSPYLRPYPISIWQLTCDAISRSKSFWVQRASNHGLVSNQVLPRSRRMLKIRVTVVSLNPASFDYFLVKKWLREFPIVRGLWQESAYALQMLSGMVWL